MLKAELEELNRYKGKTKKSKTTNKNLTKYQNMPYNIKTDLIRSLKDLTNGIRSHNNIKIEKWNLLPVYAGIQQQISCNIINYMLYRC